MKHRKMLGLAGFTAVAAFIVLAICSSAAIATELTCTEPVEFKVMCKPGTIIKATSTHVVLHPPIGEITCQHSEIEGKTTNTGTTGETVQIEITKQTFTSCNATVTGLHKGTYEVHTHEKDSTGKSGWGAFSSSGDEITVEFLGFHCIFKTSNTGVGTIRGSSDTGGLAIFSTAGEVLPRTGGRSGAFCGSEAETTGTYSIKVPAWIDVDHPVG